ncbi:AzlD domain-containing protein [Chitinolyticbacter meiyuanensis]|uniref:AzlD domain-containing protein n=1 Tax=Chitinolyticbacter meiyuanensis TaxID=682798 RepID=UPI0011E5A242|nr:AzlD domain-containing protein [Chitinolyticbacter meiyuanensis]
MNMVWTLAGMFVVTYGVRVVLWLGSGHAFPDSVRRALNYVPIAVLTAIVVPAVFVQEGAINTGWNNPQLAGALVTGVIVWRWNKLLAGIAGGMLVYGAWRWLV